MKALIVVDVQNDFCKGGSLAVPNGDDIVSMINKLMDDYDLVVATLDYHPQNHGSFAKSADLIGTMGELNGLPQVQWPVHCVENTFGAELHPELNKSKVHVFVKKGTNPKVDSYSGFFDNDKSSKTELDQVLKRNNVTQIDVVGLALDYCVKATAIDGANLGYKTRVLVNATKAANLNSGDDKKALEELSSSGVELA